MILGIKTTGGVSKLKTKTTDGVTKAVECACCAPFLIILQGRFAEGEGNMAGAYRGFTDFTTFFGDIKQDVLLTWSDSFVNDESKCPGGSNRSSGETEIWDGLSTHSIVTENYRTFIERQTYGSISISSYSSYGEYPDILTSFDENNFDIGGCTDNPDYTCSMSNTSVTMSRSEAFSEEEECGTYSYTGSESRSRTLTNQLSYELAEEWARENFEAFLSPPFEDPVPLLGPDGSVYYDSSGFASLTAVGNFGQYNRYVRIHGDKDYRLLFPASRSPVDPPSSELYVPSPTGYLKVWLRKITTITLPSEFSAPTPPQTTVDDSTQLVFAAKKQKSELVANEFYASDTYPIDSDFMSETIQSSASATKTRRIDVMVLGYTFDANYTGSAPPP